MSSRRRRRRAARDRPTEPDHRDDGLDLARAMTRASARVQPGAAGPQAASAGRRSRRPAPGSPAPTPTTATRSCSTPPLGRLVADHGWELDLRVHGVFGRWAELVGAEVAAHCTPESFADGRLVVRTDSTAWATQLQLLAPTVVRRLNEELGPRHGDRDRGARPARPDWKKGPRSVRDGRGPRDTYG